MTTAPSLLEQYAPDTAERVTSLVTDAIPADVEKCSDLANAYRIARDEGADIRFNEELGGYMVFDGCMWRPDHSAAMRRAIASMRKLLRYANATAERARTKEAIADAQQLARHAAKAQHEPQLRRSLELLQHLESIATTVDQWDTDRTLFNCINGTIDLSTGELREHRREDLITKVSAVSYNPSASCPLFDAFLQTILPDEEVRAFIQRFAGYALSGSTTEQVFVIAYGTGANGKTAFYELVKRVVGSYGTEAQADTFTLSKGGRPIANKLADLRGARFVTSSESGEGKRLDEILIKRFTGGDDVVAHVPFGKPFHYYPQGKLALLTNHKPDVTGIDHGIWRRILLVPFTTTIAPEQQDPDLLDKLLAEREGILRWMVEGHAEWRRLGRLNPPNAVKAAVEEYRADSNDVRRFVDERCVKLEGAKAKSSALYGAFREWAKTEGAAELSNKAFTQRVRALGFEKKHASSGETWQGIGLRADEMESER